MPSAAWQGTVYHGLPRTLFKPTDKPGDISRSSDECRLRRASFVRSTLPGRPNLPLMIAARIYPEERAYFDAIIAPLLDASQGLVHFVGEIGGREKEAFLGHARALLFPIEWAEPFGLVMIESLACGTPVIAWRRGSVPEIIDDGETGFIVGPLRRRSRRSDESTRSIGTPAVGPSRRASTRPAWPAST